MLLKSDICRNRVDGIPMHTLPRGDAHWAVSRWPSRPGVASWSWEGAIAQKADYLDEIIWQLMHSLNWTWFWL